MGHLKVPQGNYVPNDILFSTYKQLFTFIYLFMILEFRYLQFCETKLSQFKVCVFTALPFVTGVTEKKWVGSAWLPGGQSSLGASCSCLIQAWALKRLMGINSHIRASLVAQSVKRLSAMQETTVSPLDQEHPLEKKMSTHSRILAWEFHGQRSVVGYNPEGHKESDKTKWPKPHNSWIIWDHSIYFKSITSLNYFPQMQHKNTEQ